MIPEAHHVRVARLQDLPPGGMVSLEVDGHPILLARVDGTVYAVSDECTHDGAPLSEGDLEETTVVCPWHFSRFCLRTGSVLESPAVTPVTSHEVRVVDGDVYVGLAPARAE